MTDVLMLAAAGLSLGAMYALVALGFSVIFRASRVFNFAHGELLAIGAFSMTSLVERVPWPAALAIAMAITGTVAALIERVVVRPMIGRPVFVTIILTLFVALLLHAAAAIAWGGQPRALPDPFGDATLGIGAGAEVPYQTLAQIGVAVLAVGGFFVLLGRTRLGVAMRATSADQEVALALGIPVGRIFGATWFLAGMFAGLAGVFAAMKNPTFDHLTMQIVAFRSFPAVIVGGLTSPSGAVIAGFLLGATEIFAPAYLRPYLGSFGDNLQDVFPYVVMILFLMVRPYGLLGQRDVERL